LSVCKIIVGGFGAGPKCSSINSKITKLSIKVNKIEQKGMTLNPDYGYSFPLCPSHIKKMEEEKENE
jgi:hypothetical protein